MNSQTDELFLVLQFKNKICSKMGIEFQSFFEEIMQESCPNFKKVRTIQTRSYYRRREKTLGALYGTRIYKV